MHGLLLIAIAVFLLTETVASAETPQREVPAATQPFRLAAIRCPSNMYFCAPGAQGSGGCYIPSRDSCYGGRMCPNNMVNCPRGSQGGGGCYIPSRDSCYSGRMCPNYMVHCASGPRGSGGCYLPNRYRCDRGRII